MNFRIGMGYDVHATQQGSSIILGGISIPSPFSLRGHSDADVLLHAITDALLGALNLGDIGDHFPDSSTENKNRNSADFLQHAHECIIKEGYSISNIDTIVICEKPKISPHKQSISENIASILAIEPNQISVKATTTEKLGPMGRGEGIAAKAIVLLQRES